MRAVGKLGWKNATGEGPEFEIRTVYDLFDLIERRPALYLGVRSLSALRGFVDGYTCCMLAYGIDFDKTVPDFGGFHEYVAMRYNWRESTAGWCNIILRECGMVESQAYEQFFSLLRSYRDGESGQV